jgi:hypothetical protein
MITGDGDPMPEMLPFRYVEFYDVPRCIVLQYRGQTLLLQSAFDEVLDDYSETYSVYPLHGSVQALLEGSWEFLETLKATIVGKIRVDSVRFDGSKRLTLDPSCLDKLICPASPR